MTTPTYTSLRHKIAAASATKRANHLQWASDLAAARDVAVAAVIGLTPTPMVVADRDGRQWVVDGGPCGFARVEVRPRNTAFARWLVQYAGWMSSDYHKCVYMNISDYGQSMERKEVFAQAFADCLTRLGHERVTYTSTID